MRYFWRNRKRQREKVIHSLFLGEEEEEEERAWRLEGLYEEGFTPAEEKRRELAQILRQPHHR